MKTKILITICFLLISCKPAYIDQYLIGMFSKDSEIDRCDIHISPNTCSDDGTFVVPEGQIADSVDGLEVPYYDKTEIILRRTAYTTSYDKTNKIPKWVAWHLTSTHTDGTQKRLSNFIVDEQVPNPRAEIVDYKGSGYDRGHMCPAGDNKWCFESMRESFLLTNICPQDHNLNCGDWNELEILCRDWANKYGEIYIVCGPIFSNEAHKYIGPNKVSVPDAFFKVVLRMNGTPQGIGFLYDNRPCNKKPISYSVSIDQVELITGIDFFYTLPDDIENEVESKYNFNNW